MRINPGNLINGRQSLEEIVRTCKERGVAIRIGVNSGSIDALDQRGQMERIQGRLREDGTLERSDPAEARRKERERLASSHLALLLLTRISHAEPLKSLSSPV